MSQPRSLSELRARLEGLGRRDLLTLSLAEVRRSIPNDEIGRILTFLGERLKRDTLERLSYLLGIYKALQILLPAAAAADAWVKKPNSAPLFGGRSALDRMLGGNVADLVAVRQYLDARRGGWA